MPTIVKALEEKGASVTVHHLKDFTPVWVDSRDLEAFPPEYKKLFDEVSLANGIFFVTPIYNYTVSSPTKALSEIIGDALEKKPVAIVTSAGTIRSHLATRDLMASMIYEQKTICYSNTVQVVEEMIENGTPNTDTTKRLTGLAHEFVSFVNALIPFCDEQKTAE